LRDGRFAPVTPYERAATVLGVSLSCAVLNKETPSFAVQ